ncbi:anthranilate phosphoribosyltransferase [Thermosyntropha sp.]|uniref:anthranilate phosphoribosyltransferase n=1 Tax=Thermosyntropha sp. TaxID=2740820 RepID=UPI0025F35F04|nr:anthranilate phosphoribosyltransferase [Thermosyntropha sp.]MBO8158770.1 anthranilate phosphoribosyltransferase [Thermosyntropha sp.]
MLERYLKKVTVGEFLSTEEAYDLAKMLLHNEVPDIKAAALLGAMRSRKESSAEILGFVKAIYEEAVKVETDLEVIDTCGTGGDGLSTFNISTAAALVVASCGVPVAKHGNRAVTGKVGSADILEGLGVNINLKKDEALRILEEIGITFFFAPSYHPILKEVAPLRRSLGFPTIFNFLGPLLNPCPLTYQVMGIADNSMQAKIAEVLKKLGRKRAMVVNGENGMDEISPVGKTKVCEIKDDLVYSYKVDAVELGFHSISLDMLKGGDLKKNTAVFLSVLNGEYSPYRQAVALNAAAALTVAEKAKSINEGLSMAYEAIDSGKAMNKLKEMIALSRDGVNLCSIR